MYYAIRLETFDCTLEEPCFRTKRKSEAVKLARALARSIRGYNRVWVEDTVTDLRLESFKVKVPAVR